MTGSSCDQNSIGVYASFINDVTLFSLTMNIDTIQKKRTCNITFRSTSFCKFAYYMALIMPSPLSLYIVFEQTIIERIREHTEGVSANVDTIGDECFSRLNKANQDLAVYFLYGILGEGK